VSRQDLVPASALPLAYFAWAHAGLALALLVLIAHPDLPGGYFLHPRMVAVVHLVTIAWISGSILGAFYVVAPLALGMPLPVRRGDWIAWAAFVAGTVGMVFHSWGGGYGGMAGSGGLVLWAVIWVAQRAARGLRRATAPWPVLLHVMLAFANMIAAALFGVVLGLDRAYGFFHIPPVAGAFSHAHLAAIGWPVMMVVGLAYRLVPMFLPARMPTGRGLAVSAVLIELGLLIIVVALLAGSPWLPAGAAIVAAGLGSFVRQMRGTVKHRLPRPPALPQRDWSTWQTHVALLWLLVAAGVGLVLTIEPVGGRQIRLAWIYGVAGLVGFVAQIVVGIQGRLMPLYAYYRAMAARGGQPPERAANQLPTAAFARPIFLVWTAGVPWLAWGLATGQTASVAGASAVLLVGVATGAMYLVFLIRTAQSPA
jgi:hypothetical protein